jgi:hypothetical protein
MISEWNADAIFGKRRNGRRLLGIFNPGKIAFGKTRDGSQPIERHAAFKAKRLYPFGDFLFVEIVHDCRMYTKSKTIVKHNRLWNQRDIECGFF